MRRYVQKFTNDLRNFTYENVDMGKLGPDLDDAHHISQKKGAPLNEDFPQAEESEDAEEQPECFFCKFCERELKNNATAIRHHSESKTHKNKFKEFKLRYCKFIKKAKKLVLHAKRPRNEGFRRLVYFKLLTQFE